METENPPLPTQLLEAQGAWVRRLARALVGDSAAAEDLVQETWETVLRSPPRHGAAVRGWLRRIVSTRAQNAARARDRRLARDGAAQAVADGVAPSPEEIAARVEIQRRLAAGVEALSEAYREVVYLRYFEGHEPSEIARRLALPAGTVRWRIKTALEELRRRLDREDRDGERRWVAVLGTLANEDRRVVIWRRGWSVAMAFLGGAALVVVVVARLAGSHTGHGASPVAPGVEKPGSTPPPSSGSTPLAITAPASCEAAAELRRVLAVRQQEVDNRELPDVLFRRSASNPVGQKAFGAVYERGMNQITPKCDYTLECRATVCQVRMLVPAGTRPTSCFPGGDGSRWVRDRLDTRISMMMNIGDPKVVDPTSGRQFQRFDVFYRLARLDGEPAPGEAWKPPAVAPGLLGSHSVPDSLSGACRDEVVRVRGALLDAEARLSALLTPQEAFAVSEPNPSTAAEVSSELTKLVGLGRELAAFRVQCRGLVCSVDAERMPPALANQWHCDAPQSGKPEVCRIDDGAEGWYVRIQRAVRGSDLLARSLPPVRRDGKEEGAFVRVRSEKERGRVDTVKWTCQMAERVEVASILMDCTRRFPLEHGTVDLTLRIPGPDDPAPRRATVSFGGALGNGGLSKCLTGSLNALFDAQETPELRNGTTIYRTLTFPGARSLWGDRSPCGK